MPDGPLSGLLKTLEQSGFVFLGGFSPDRDDDIPACHDGRRARTLVLTGNAGSTMFSRFASACDPRHHSLDDWTRRTLEPVAKAHGARALFPFDKPHLAFLTWAARTGVTHTSPLGLSIHPQYGLWHAYRAAFIFPENQRLPATIPSAHPCKSCPDRPCLTACPVSAFTQDTYNVKACRRHLATPRGGECTHQGCLARRACPVGRNWLYLDAQIRFHMVAFTNNHPF